jgi:hypothetical protein
VFHDTPRLAASEYAFANLRYLSNSRQNRLINDPMKPIVRPSRKPEIRALVLLFGTAAAAWYMHQGFGDFLLTIFLGAIPLGVVWLMPNIKNGARR